MGVKGWVTDLDHSQTQRDECVDESGLKGNIETHLIPDVALTQADEIQWKPQLFQADTGSLWWSRLALPGER